MHHGLQELAGETARLRAECDYMMSLLDRVEQVALVEIEAIGIGGGERDPERLAAGDDRHLANRVPPA